MRDRVPTLLMNDCLADEARAAEAGGADWIHVDHDDDRHVARTGRTGAGPRSFIVVAWRLLRKNACSCRPPEWQLLEAVKNEGGPTERAADVMQGLDPRYQATERVLT